MVDISKKQLPLISGHPFSSISKLFVKKQIEFEDGQDGFKDRKIMRNNEGEPKSISVIHS